MCTELLSSLSNDSQEKSKILMLFRVGILSSTIFDEQQDLSFSLWFLFDLCDPYLKSELP